MVEALVAPRGAGKDWYTAMTMSTDKPSKSDDDYSDPAGPQGTQVFSGEEVERLLAASEDSGELASRQASLIGRSAPLEGKRIPLRDSRLIMGRGTHCDLSIEESSVSSEHARLSRDGEGWRVVNLLSTNGTFVNDRRVSNAPLVDGDVIRLGRVELVFHGPRATTSGSSSPPVLRRVGIPVLLGGGLVLLILAIAGLYQLT